jgi:hypothetical protein
MNRLFRSSQSRVSGYAALAIFAAAYLGALALVLAPGAISGLLP